MLDAVFLLVLELIGQIEHVSYLCGSPVQQLE